VNRFAAAILTLGFFASAVSAQAPSAKAMHDRIAAILEPGAKIVPGDLGRKPLDRPMLNRLANPTATIPGVAAATPRLPLVARKATAPSVTREGLPLASSRYEPQLPAPIVLPEQPLVRVPSVDIEQPLPVQLLAQQVRDRTSVADPSLDISVAAALAAQTPFRTQPAPFQPLNLPDPFELQTQIRPRLPADETTQPPAIFALPPTAR